jgi:hypothetical protein
MCSTPLGLSADEVLLHVDRAASDSAIHPPATAESSALKLLLLICNQAERSRIELCHVCGCPAALLSTLRKLLHISGYIHLFFIRHSNNYEICARRDGLYYTGSTYAKARAPGGSASNANEHLSFRLSLIR